MAVSEATIGVTEGTQKNLDTTTVTQTAGATAHREVVVVADPEVLAAYAKIAATTQEAAFGLHIRNPKDHELLDVLRAIATQIQITNMHLALITDTHIGKEDVDDDNH